MLQSRLRVGELDRPIVIQSYTESADSVTNQRAKTWSDTLILKAKRIATKSKVNETYQANQQVGTETYEYTVRPGSTVVNQKMRIYDTWETRYFYITGVNRIDRMGTTILTAEYRDND
jgi:hypothetical protein